MTNFPAYWAAAAAAWPTIWLADLLRYLIVAAAFTAILAWAPTAWLVRRTVRIRQIASGQRLREFGHSMLTVVIFSLVGASVFLGFQAGCLKIYASADEYGWLWLVSSFFVMVVAQDAWFYWTHRLMHHRRMFRWAHRTHHQSLAPTPWTAYSFAPAEALVQAIFLPLFLLVLPVHPTVAFLWVTHMVVRNVAGHAGVELIPRAWLAGWWGRWLTTTLHHEMHHAYANSNYGLYFVWWDRWCGTEHPGYQDGLWALTGRLHQVRAGAVAPQPAPEAGSKTSTVLLALLVAGAGVWVTPDARAAGVLGEWATQGHSARVNIQPCQGASEKMCGTITWLWDPVDGQGRPVVDAKHPDTARRGQPLIGLEMLAGFKPGPVVGSWVEGQIYNPEDGRTYNSRMKLRSPEVLEVEGCVLVFCTRQIWRRVPRRCDGESKAVASLSHRGTSTSSIQPLQLP